MTRRILLHVGTPKTGTSALQDVLFRNSELLAEAGIRYPADRFDAHFLAALDLMRLPWGGLEQEAVGAWDRLVAGVDAAGPDDTVVISHEILARASRADVERALVDLGRDRGAEIHVVISARDLSRQIPAEWQENVKHRAELTYRAFLDQITDPARKGRIGSWFWGVQELPDILDRWAGDLPAERVHVITVPPPGSDPGLLWQRFTETFGLAGLELDLGNDRSNPSLGVPETALVRRINVRMNARLPPPDYRPLVRELLAHQTLSQRRDSARLTLPQDLRGWVRDLEDSWVAALTARDCHVVGDLADLRGPRPDAVRTGDTDSPASTGSTDSATGTAWADPDRPVEAEVADAALDAIDRLLLRAAADQHELDRLRGALADTEQALERSYLRPTYRLREKSVRVLQASGPGRLALRVYRRLRGR